jgi:hypothetical protein
VAGGGGLWPACGGLWRPVELGRLSACTLRHPSDPTATTSSPRESTTQPMETVGRSDDGSHRVSSNGKAWQRFVCTLCAVRARSSLAEGTRAPLAIQKTGRELRCLKTGAAAVEERRRAGDGGGEDSARPRDCSTCQWPTGRATQSIEAAAMSCLSAGPANKASSDKLRPFLLCTQMTNAYKSRRSRRACTAED